MTDAPDKDERVAAGLRKIRRRRRCLLGLILGYGPAIWVTLKLTNSDAKAGLVFAVWVCLIAVSSALTALSICPRCSNHFHMNGFIPLYFLRRCLHCGLDLHPRREPK